MMYTMLSTPNSNCRNVMEIFVLLEVEHQWQLIPPRLKPYINKVDIMTYAMNRLPALYASSERGWQCQIERTKKEYKEKITHAVRQAIAAVQRDPLRSATPLKPIEPLECRTALGQLKELLQKEELSWNTLPTEVEQALVKAAEGEIVWRPKRHLPPRGYRWEGDNLVKLASN